MAIGDVLAEATALEENSLYQWRGFQDVVRGSIQATFEAEFWDSFSRTCAEHLRALEQLDIVMESLRSEIP